MRSLMLGMAGALMLAGAASAHPKLLSSAPAPGATVAAPHEIRINFSEGVYAKLSGVMVKSKAGAAVKTGATSVDKSMKQMTVPLEGALAPGAYVVDWHAVSTDTHHVKGQFGFTVK